MARAPVPPREVDRLLGAIAAAQGGAIGHPQLVSLGMRASEVQHRQRDGRLHREFRGVYSVGTPLLPRRGQLAAALLTTWPHTALSHLTAGASLALTNPGPGIHVTAPTRAGQRGLTVHRGELPREHVMWHDGLLVTRPGRLFLDLATTAPRKTVRQAVEQAEVRDLFDRREVDAVLRWAGRRPGVRVVRSVLEELAAASPPPAVMRSELEQLLRDLCFDHGLPLPQFNVVVHGYEVDAWFSWAAFGIECDSWAFHRGHGSFEDDRERQNDLDDLGITLHRLTHQAMTDRWPVVSARIVRRLERALRQAVP